MNFQPGDLYFQEVDVHALNGGVTTIDAGTALTAVVFTLTPAQALGSSPASTPVAPAPFTATVRPAPYNYVIEIIGFVPQSWTPGTQFTVQMAGTVGGVPSAWKSETHRIPFPDPLLAWIYAAQTVELPASPDRVDAVLSTVASATLLIAASSKLAVYCPAGATAAFDPTSDYTPTACLYDPANVGRRYRVASIAPAPGMPAGYFAVTLTDPLPSPPSIPAAPAPPPVLSIFG